MMNQLPPELFSQQPVRSEFARSRIEGNPHRWRLIALIAGVLTLIGGCYYIFSDSNEPAEIPTIQAEGIVKERPEQPGGAEIPHQDMLVFDKIEGSGQETKTVERLMPQPEVPQPEAIQQVGQPIPTSTPETTVVGLTTNTGLPQQAAVTVPSAAPVVAAAPVVVPDMEKKVSTVETISAPKVEPLATTVKEVKKEEPKAESIVQKAAPAVLPKEMTDAPKVVETPKAVEKTVEKVEKKAAPVAVSAGGPFVVQFASIPNADAAQTALKNTSSRYASLLKDIKLRVARADLGAKGVYHRVQSTGMSEAQARSLCASLKTSGASCIVVRP